MSFDLAGIRVEDLDLRLQLSPTPVTPLSQANTVKNLMNRFWQTMVEKFVMTGDDYSISDGKHGTNISFSQKVHKNLEFDWRCAVNVKLMGKPNYLELKKKKKKGKPNSTNAFHVGWFEMKMETEGWLAPH